MEFDLYVSLIAKCHKLRERQSEGFHRRLKVVGEELDKKYPAHEFYSGFCPPGSPQNKDLKPDERYFSIDGREVPREEYQEKLHLSLCIGQIKKAEFQDATLKILRDIKSDMSIV